MDVGFGPGEGLGTFIVGLDEAVDDEAVDVGGCCCATEVKEAPAREWLARIEKLVSI